MKHTPTPWKAGGKYAGEITIDLSDGTIRISGRNATTNAEFIVKAVNNHDALVEALSSLLSLGVAEYDNWEKWEEVIAARAMLANLK